jgi:phospholipid-binding lipoprotein MlaA
VRDSVGLVVDWYSTPVAYIPSRNWRWGLAILYGVDLRADLLGAGDLLQQAALDPYEFTRDAYLQKRSFDVHDGNPPESEQDGGGLEDQMFLEEELFQEEVLIRDESAPSAEEVAPE